MKIVIASDHGAFQLKQQIVEFLQTQEGVELLDVGTNNETQSVNYPDFAAKAVQAIRDGKAERGIILCGTGIGISIAANKFKGIRAALCHDAYTARMSRLHNNANILAFGGRTTGIEIAKEMVTIWLTTRYEGNRHQNRLDLISAIEEKECLK